MKIVAGALLFLSLFFAQQSFAQCVDKAVNVAVDKSTKVVKVKAADIPGGSTRFDGIDLGSGDAEKESLFSAAYVFGVTRDFGTITLATSPPMVVEITYLNGGSERFLHASVAGSWGNYRIPGTQKGKAGVTLCDNREVGQALGGELPETPPPTRPIIAGNGPFFLPTTKHGWACTESGDGQDKVYSCQRY